MQKTERVCREFLAAGTGAVLVDGALNPFSVLMVRAQLQPRAGVAELAKFAIAQCGFFRGLWVPGLLAMSMKSMCSSGLRVGFYPSLRDVLPHGGLGERMLAGALTGALGTFVANPIEVVRIRMLSPAPYASTLGAFFAVSQAEGTIAGLWRGAGAHAACAALFSGTQLAAYDTTKQTLLYWEAFEMEGPVLHLLASFLSGFCAQCVSHPVATLKTIVMDARGTKSNIITRVAGLLSDGGVIRFYKGLIPALACKAPGMMLYLPLVEQLRFQFGVGYI